MKPSPLFDEVKKQVWVVEAGDRRGIEADYLPMTGGVKYIREDVVDGLVYQRQGRSNIGTQVAVSFFVTISVLASIVMGVSFL